MQLRGILVPGLSVVGAVWPPTGGLRMQSPDETVPSLAEHAVLEVMLFSQQRIVVMLASAASPWGREGALCPQLLLPLFPLGKDLAGPLRRSSRRDISILPELGQLAPPLPTVLSSMGPWVLPQGVETRVPVPGPVWAMCQGPFPFLLLEGGELLLKRGLRT